MPGVVSLSYSEVVHGCHPSGLFPVVRSNLHPVHTDELQPMLLGELDGLERPPLGKLLAADVLGLEVQAIQDRLPEQNEQVSVRF